VNEESIIQKKIMKPTFDPNIPEPIGKRIVIVGGGFAGIEFAKKINTRYYQVVLLDKNNYHQFQPLFYQVATAGIEPSAISYPFRKLFQHKKNFHFRVAQVEGVDTVKKELATSIGSIRYDYLVMAMGAVTNFFGNSLLEQNTYQLKSISEALTFRNSILRKFEEALLADEANRKRLLQFVIVGGGPTGVEVAGALAEMKKFILPKDYPELDFDDMQIYLVEGSGRVLAGMSEDSSARAADYLEEFGVQLIRNKTVRSYDGTIVALSDGSTIETKTVVWAAGIKAASMEGIDPSILLKNNRMQVDAYNRVLGYHDIFALGDQAANEKPLPQVAQVAIQQGKQLARNLNKGLDPRKWKAFTYRDMGSMATIGRNKAVAEIFGFRFQGFVAWFVWMFVHLISILGVKNRVQTFINWAWNYFTYDQSLRLMFHMQKDAGLASWPVSEKQVRKQGDSQQTGSSSRVNL
jgi:NADH:ubiquinone reductase (H+-translocating)